MIRLGRNQKDLLHALNEHRGEWNENSGWLWDTNFNTDAILNSMVKYELVERIGTVGFYGHYRITDLGRRYASGAKPRNVQ